MQLSSMLARKIQEHYHQALLRISISCPSNSSKYAPTHLVTSNQAYLIPLEFNIYEYALLSPPTNIYSCLCYKHPKKLQNLSAMGRIALVHVIQLWLNRFPNYVLLGCIIHGHRQHMLGLQGSVGYNRVHFSKSVRLTSL